MGAMVVTEVVLMEASRLKAYNLLLFSLISEHLETLWSPPSQPTM